MLDPGALGSRLNGVRDRVANAATRAGRDPASISIVAVSKTFPAAAIQSLAQLGQLDFGENRVQEAFEKMDATANLPLRWHLVGHLQSNKARKAAARFAVVHSVDSEDLLRKLDEAARSANRVIECLAQADLAGEATKYGAATDVLPAIFRAARECPNARLSGLMLLPPLTESPEGARPYFRALRRMRDDLLDQGTDPAALAHLSMGMSHDFEVAIEEGATLVRIGAAIFGER